jgi:predicted acetyltransferase
LSPVFRAGGADDVPAFARLGVHSFPGVGASAEQWEQILSDPTLGGIATHWVGEDDGRLVAACRLLRFRQWIGGAAIPIMGLAAVAISPADRRRGLAAQLTTSGFHRARERGDVASALYPFRTSFYRKLGYGLAGEVQQFQIPPAALPDDPGRERVRLAETATDRGAVAAVYERWAPTQSGQLQRDASAWDRVWEGGRHGVIYREQGGDPAGYAVFRYLADAHRGARAVEVEEIAWLSTPARLALFGWIRSLSDQWDRILYRALPDQRFADHLAEVRFPMEGVPRWHFWFGAAFTLYGPMFRLLDLPGAWNARRWIGGSDFALNLLVDDIQVPENAGAWTLAVRGEAGSLERRSGAADATLTLGIEALSRIYIGALSPSAAVAAGLATIDPGAALPRIDAALRVPGPWMFDRF